MSGTKGININNNNCSKIHSSKVKRKPFLIVVRCAFIWHYSKIHAENMVCHGKQFKQHHRFRYGWHYSIWHLGHKTLPYSTLDTLAFRVQFIHVEMGQMHRICVRSSHSMNFKCFKLKMYLYIKNEVVQIKCFSRRCPLCILVMCVSVACFCCCLWRMQANHSTGWVLTPEPSIKHVSAYKHINIKHQTTLNIEYIVHYMAMLILIYSPHQAKITAIFSFPVGKSFLTCGFLWEKKLELLFCFVSVAQQNEENQNKKTCALFIFYSKCARTLSDYQRQLVQNAKRVGIYQFCVCIPFH